MGFPLPLSFRANVAIIDIDNIIILMLLIILITIKKLNRLFVSKHLLSHLHVKTLKKQKNTVDLAFILVLLAWA